MMHLRHGWHRCIQYWPIYVVIVVVLAEMPCPVVEADNYHHLGRGLASWAAVATQSDKRRRQKGREVVLRSRHWSSEVPSPFLDNLGWLRVKSKREKSEEDAKLFRDLRDLYWEGWVSFNITASNYFRLGYPFKECIHFFKIFVLYEFVS